MEQTIDEEEGTSPYTQWRFDDLKLFYSEDWIWQLHQNQSYLGRMILLLRRDTRESLATCTSEEWDSLHLHLRAYESFVSRLFAPDRYNYCQLGNIYEQLHVHAIPRYKTLRRWSSYEFSDQRWGRNWPPASPSPLSPDATYDFAKWLREKISEDLLVRGILQGER